MSILWTNVLDSLVDVCHLHIRQHATAGRQRRETGMATIISERVDCFGGDL